MNKYRVEVKARNHIVDFYESNDIRKILEWYQSHLCLGASYVYERQKIKNNLFQRVWNVLTGQENKNWEWVLI